MKRLHLHIVLFLLPLILLIFLFPVPGSKKYAGLENDCSNRASWMYDRIFRNPSPVDIAFVGSSRTVNSVNEQLMEDHLREFQLLNFAYCRYGRNLHYRLIKTLVEEKDLRYLVLEVRAEENPYSHPVFPYFAENEDLITSYPFFNVDWFSDWTTAFQYRLQLTQEVIWQPDTIAVADTNAYGFLPNLSSPDLDELALEKAKRSLPRSNSFKRQLEDVFPLHYLKRIGRYCRKNDVQILFLYLPAYGVKLPEPPHAELYKEYGNLLIPPQTLFENEKLWADPNHLNPQGSEILSLWLAERLANELE